MSCVTSRWARDDDYHGMDGAETHIAPRAEQARAVQTEDWSTYVVVVILLGAAAYRLQATISEIELTLGRLRSTLGPLLDPRARAALAELERLLAPLVGTYAAVVRHLSTLAREESASEPAQVATGEQTATRG